MKTTDAMKYHLQKAPNQMLPRWELLCLVYPKVHIGSHQNGGRMACMMRIARNNPCFLICSDAETIALVK